MTTAYIKQLEAERARLVAALQVAQLMCDEALPKFNWGASALDGNAIKLLNEVPILIKAALAPYAMQGQVIEIDGQKWKVRQAVSRAEADNAIAMARVTGSVASSQVENDIVVADVVRLNDDGTEHKPYGSK